MAKASSLQAQNLQLSRQQWNWSEAEIAEGKPHFLSRQKGTSDSPVIQTTNIYETNRDVLSHKQNKVGTTEISVDSVHLKKNS